MSDASDEEPLGAKPSGVGSPLNSSRYSRPTTGSLAQTTRGPAAGGGDVFGGGARPRSNGDVLGGGGGGGDELGGGDPGGYGASYGSGGGGGGINGGSGRPQSAALNRARDLQLKKRSDRLMSQGMAVANDGGVGHLSRPLQALAQPAPPQSKPEPVPTVYAQPATLVGKPVPTVYCTAAPVPRLAAMPATMDSVDALTARDEADVPIQSFLQHCARV
ncbi:hypothetical protein T492DRAFT_14265 [Pavlovales sp. CCMP2436]|nr:hypothetical protein T492DRAFT_14265 [Pavlovales sp. CCMP2436]